MKTQYLVNKEAARKLFEMSTASKFEGEVSILARRWVDSYGNTYHHVYILMCCSLVNQPTLA